MTRRLAGCGVVAAAALGGLLFAPVFTLAVLAPPVVAAALPVLVVDQVALGRRAAAWWRGPVAAGAALLAVLATVLRDTAPATIATTVRTGVLDGWRLTLASTWPTRDDPTLYLFVPLLVVVAAVVGVELLRGGWTLAAVLPGPALGGLAQAFAPTGGTAALVAGLGLCVAGAVVLAGGSAAVASRSSRRGASPPGRGRPAAAGAGPGPGALRAAVAAPAGWVRPAAVSLSLVALAGAVTWAVAPDADAARSLHEERDTGLTRAAAVNPLDQIAERLRDPSAVVFRDRPSAPVDRWPMVVLDDFDGHSWTSTGRYRPLGARLPAAGAARHTATVRLSGALGPWLPTTGHVVAVTGTDVLVDPGTGTVVSTAPAAATPGAGLSYELTWSAPRPTAAQLVAARAVDGPYATPPPGVPESFGDLARAAVGPPSSPFGTALALEQHFRRHYRLASGGKLPTGHGYAQLDHFLTEGGRGTSEQFAAAYVVLARTLGLPVRLVVGFRQPARPDPDGGYTVRNRDVLAWPEIHLVDLGWVPLDPTARAGTAGDTAGSLAAAVDEARNGPVAVAKPAAGAQQSTPPPPPAAAPVPPDGDGAPAAGRVLAALAAVALAVAWPVGVPLAKRVRAWRRRRGPTVLVVDGACAEVRDRLLDHGVPVPRGATLRELAAAVPELRDTAGGQALHSLGRCADRALWSPGPPSPATAEQAWQAVGTVTATLACRPLPARLRAAVNPHSLRRRRRARGAR
jgi:hypothetical protein